MSEPLKVWSKFSVTKKDGSVLNLRIVDIPKDPKIIEKALDTYFEYFIKEERTFKAAGVPDSEEAMQELRAVFDYGMNSDSQQKIEFSICCLDTGDDQINDVIGGSILIYKTKADVQKKHVFKAKALNKVSQMAEDLAEIYDDMRAFNLDRYFICRGVFVCPEYRGLGIAQEFFRIRRLISKEYGIPITGAWMTSPGTQKAAERDGWETVCELKFADLEKKFNVTYEKFPPTNKFMIARIQL
ncbi:unnamed protein product [Spodoptera littoralis]|uniref:N-acetyltransferase domain-containing protein n=1 Tax=Spodoptera littoralis TaxID=7109 RepID=A0A9P0N8I0_SPOLI|nr:unnamed protein product [Spodoptera littoralis]CAH1645395.1 unnamed protein product [Spodoptera littoralis]